MPSVGDTRILNGRAIVPMMLPMLPPMRKKMVIPLSGKPLGTTPIITRRFGENSLWQNTPLESAASVGNVYQLDDVFSNWDAVGFEWNFPQNRLEAYLTRQGQTYRVLIPAAKIKAILEGTSKALGLRKSCLCNTPNRLRDILQTSAKWLGATEEAATVGNPLAEMMRLKVAESAQRTRERVSRMSPQELEDLRKRAAERAWKKKCQGFNLECFVSDAVKEAEKAVNNIGDGVSSFFNDPAKWIQYASRDVGKFIDEVGLVALDVVSHPIFTGIAGALSFVPPLNAVGGAALAASAAANAVKPALNVVGSVAKAVGGDPSAIGSVPGVGNLIKGIVPKAVLNTSKDVEAFVDKAGATVEHFKAGTVKLPKAAQGLMVAALQSTPAPAAKAHFSAQATPQGTQASLYLPPTSGMTLMQIVSAMPPNLQPLWNKAMQSLHPNERAQLGPNLRVPFQGKSAWEFIITSDSRSPLRSIPKALKSLKGVAGRQISGFLMQARA